MKTQVKRLMLCAVLSFFGVVVSVSCAHAANTYSTTQKTQLPGITRGKIIEGKYMQTEKVTCLPEVLKTLENEKQNYSKTVILNEEFYVFNEKKSDFEIKSDYKVEITFTYDKESFVKVENPAKDIKSQISADKWKLRDITQSYPGDSAWVVSNKYTLYEPAKMGLGDEVLNGHGDIICSFTGDIGINSNFN